MIGGLQEIHRSYSQTSKHIIKLTRIRWSVIGVHIVLGREGVMNNSVVSLLEQLNKTGGSDKEDRRHGSVNTPNKPSS